MAEAKGSMASGLTAAINQTFKFGKIVVMGTTLIVSTALVRLLGWLAGLDGLTGDKLAFLRYIFQMLGTIGAFYLMLSAMTAVTKMTAAEASGKKMGFIGGFAAMTTNFVKVVFATIVPIAVLVVAVGLLWLIGLIGAIPKVGPIVWGIAAIVPILIGLIAAFVLAKLFLTVFLIPGIIATTNQSGYKCYKAASEIVKTRMVKLLGWFIAVFILVTLFFTILATGIGIMQSHTQVTMGTNNSQVMTAAPILKVLTPSAIRIGDYTVVAPNVGGFTPTYVGLGEAVVKTGGWFYGIELGIVLAILTACGYIFFTVGGMYAGSALASEPEDPIALKVPVNIDNITARAAKFTESVSEKMKAELSEEEQKEKKSKKEG